MELILNTAGFTMVNFELIRGGAMMGYEFDAHLNGAFEFNVASDSFEDAVRETLLSIYDTEGVKFNGINV